MTNKKRNSTLAAIAAITKKRADLFRSGALNAAKNSLVQKTTYSCRKVTLSTSLNKKGELMTKGSLSVCTVNESKFNRLFVKESATVKVTGGSMSCENFIKDVIVIDIKGINDDNTKVAAIQGIAIKDGRLFLKNNLTKKYYGMKGAIVEAADTKAEFFNTIGMSSSQQRQENYVMLSQDYCGDNFNQFLNDLTDGAFSQYKNKALTLSDAVKFLGRMFLSYTPSRSIGNVKCLAIYNGKLDNSLFDGMGMVSEAWLKNSVSHINDHITLSMISGSGNQARLGSVAKGAFLAVRNEFIKEWIGSNLDSLKRFSGVVNVEEALATVETNSWIIIGEGDPIVAIDRNVLKINPLIDTEDGIEYNIMKFSNVGSCRLSKQTLEKLPADKLSEVVLPKFEAQINKMFTIIKEGKQSASITAIEEGYVPNLLKQIGGTYLQKDKRLLKHINNGFAQAVCDNVINTLNVAIKGASLLATADICKHFGFNMIGDKEIYCPDANIKGINTILCLKDPTLGSREYYLADCLSLQEILKRISDSGMTDNQKIECKKYYKSLQPSIIVVKADLMIMKALAGFDFDGDKLRVIYDADFINAITTSTLFVNIIDDEKSIAASRDLYHINEKDICDIVSQVYSYKGMSIGEVTNLNSLLIALSQNEEFFYKFVDQSLTMFEEGHKDAKWMNNKNFEFRSDRVLKIIDDHCSINDVITTHTLYAIKNRIVSFEDAILFLNVIMRRYQELTIDSSKDDKKVIVLINGKSVTVTALSAVRETKWDTEKGQVCYLYKNRKADPLYVGNGKLEVFTDAFSNLQDKMVKILQDKIASVEANAIDFSVKEGNMLKSALIDKDINSKVTSLAYTNNLYKSIIQGINAAYKEDEAKEVRKALLDSLSNNIRLVTDSYDDSLKGILVKIACSVKFNEKNCRVFDINSNSAMLQHCAGEEMIHMIIDHFGGISTATEKLKVSKRLEDGMILSFKDGIATDIAGNIIAIKKGLNGEYKVTVETIERESKDPIEKYHVSKEIKDMVTIPTFQNNFVFLGCGETASNKLSTKERGVVVKELRNSFESALNYFVDNQVELSYKATDSTKYITLTGGEKEIRVPANTISFDMVEALVSGKKLSISNFFMVNSDYRGEAVFTASLC